MRGINLIAEAGAELSEWASSWQERFSRVQLRHDNIAAITEGQGPDTINEVVVEQDHERVYVLDRPTTIREYEPDEISIIDRLAPGPRKYFALEYTDETLLKQMLLAILKQEGGRRVIVDDDHGDFLPLERYLERLP